MRLLFILFIFFAAVTSGCDQFCQIPQHVDLEFCLVLAESGTEEATEDEEVEEGGDEEIFVCPHREQQAWVGACVACEELDPQPGDFGQCVIVDGQAEIWHDADIDGIPDGLDNCPDDANPGQVDTDSDDQGDLCESSLFVSLSANQPRNLHNGRVQILGALIFAEEEEEIEILSLSIEVFTSELVLDPMIRLWIGEDLGFITPLVPEEGGTHTATFFVEDGPVIVGGGQPAKEVEIYADINEAQQDSRMTSCISGVQYRSTTTGIEYDIDFGREHCQTLN